MESSAGGSFKMRPPESHSTSTLAPPPILAQPLCMLPDEQPSPEQVEILRAIPGEQRLRLAERLHCAQAAWMPGLNWPVNNREALRLGPMNTRRNA